MGKQPTPWSHHRPAFGAENRATQIRLGDAAVVALTSSPAFQNGHYFADARATALGRSSVAGRGGLTLVRASRLRPVHPPRSSHPDF